MPAAIAADLLALLEEGELRSDALPLAHEHPICHQRREAADRVCQQCSTLSKGVEHGFFCCCGVSAPHAPRTARTPATTPITRITRTTRATRTARPPHRSAAAQHGHSIAQQPPRARAGL